MDRNLCRAYLPLILLLCASVQTSTAIPNRDNWTKVSSKNFTLVGDASEKDIRQVAMRLEQFREAFSRLFTRGKFDSPIPTTVIVFRNANSYRPFNPGNSAGYFQKGEDVNYITLTSDAPQDPFSVIYHEYVHLLMENSSATVPAWFNEGLAEYYSTFKVDEGRKVQLGVLIPYHLKTLREGKLYPLPTLFAVDHDSAEYNEISKRGMFYAESWALVHYLILGNNGQRQPQLEKFLQLLGNKVAADEAIKKAFQTDLATFERDFKKYIEGTSFKMQVMELPQKLEFDAALQSSPLSEAEAQAYLGDLLLHINRINEAETYLQQALASDPNLTMAQASLGIVKMRQKNFPAAKRVLRQALKGNSNNYLAHYYYAYVLSREAIDSSQIVKAYPAEAAETMRAELKKAIELRPDFPESYALLAFVNMVTGQELDESITLLKHALALQPGRQDLNLQMAQIYLRQQKFDLAKQLLESVREAKDRRLQGQAETLLASIKHYEDELAQGPAMSGAETIIVNAGDETSAKTPNDYLREALRPVQAGEQRIQGTFTTLDCDNKGIAYFAIRAADRVHKFRATALAHVRFTTFVPVSGEITCGPRKTPENVVMTFRPSKDPKDVRAKIDGDAVVVEMVPGDFILKN